MVTPAAAPHDLAACPTGRAGEARPGPGPLWGAGLLAAGTLGTAYLQRLSQRGNGLPQLGVRTGPDLFGERAGLLPGGAGSIRFPGLEIERPARGEKDAEPQLVTDLAQESLARVECGPRLLRPSASRA